MDLHLNRLDTFEPDEGYTPQHVHVSKQTYDGRMIVVDNHLYEECRFVNCNFVYSGAPFAFRNCEVEGGYLSLTGAGRRVGDLERIFEENAKNAPGPPY